MRAACSGSSVVSAPIGSRAEGSNDKRATPRRTERPPPSLRSNIRPRAAMVKREDGVAAPGAAQRAARMPVVGEGEIEGEAVANGSLAAARKSYENLRRIIS